ncbi:DUF4097 family beta strand repeat-containing protein [Saccharomonospora piscinae]|uniref:DUF4097 family beta strand repeat-containing protein n=1 Tax=Saccharomonospora piscinae TaxID=687388 RepID=UPI000462F5F4|nr:DUF4097 family beta strand repeat-containing protein [Saccharomonospora piscinae]
MSSRTETFPGARGVDVTTVADAITLDTQSSGPTRVTLVPEVPGDQAALDRIQRAEVRLSGGTVVVDVPADSGGATVVGDGITSTTVVQGNGVTIVNGRVVSGGPVGIQATHVSGSNVVVGGRSTTVSHHSGTVTGRGDVNFGPGSGLTSVGGGGGGVRVLVSAPHRAEVTARTTSGSITHRGTAGSARVSSVSGAIRLDSILGRADLDTTSGAIAVAELTGGGRVQSVSGSVSVTVYGDGAPVSVSTVSGSITRIGAADRIAASTVSGRIR